MALVYAIFGDVNAFCEWSFYSITKNTQIFHTAIFRPNGLENSYRPISAITFDQLGPRY